jgi:preprotein translocase subunit SecA
VLHSGKIAEMMTGEGKTLVSTLPVYLNALSGKGVHLVTVNEYLAKRDAKWMAPIFEFHGLRVDCIDLHEPNSEARKNAYKADITYGTNNEFGFDYLRDNMAHSLGDLVQRAPNYAIVDEVDSVLIDDARTPLIISGAINNIGEHKFLELRPVVDKLVSIQRQLLTGVLAEIKKLISSGNTKEAGVLLLRVFRGLPKSKPLIKFLSQEGIKQLLQKTENQYMQDNNREMHKIDADLYFVIDEKMNSIELTDKGISFLSEGDHTKDFFILPDLSTAIAKIDTDFSDKTENTKQKEILYQDYSAKSERIHTMNQLLRAYTLFEKEVEYVVMNKKVMIVDEQTGRIMEGRRYSDGLHQAIEAKENVKIEAATQTYASITLQNYFRMYKKLSGMTGTAATEAGEFWEIYKLDVISIPTNRPLVRKDKEDLIYKTAREKYNAVIAEIENMVAIKRPVLVGTTSVEISELLGKMLTLKKIKHNVLNAKLHKKEADIVAQAGEAGMVTIATNMAGRGTDIKLADEVKEAGGLAIIGTERHDSRRVDRQLRGRSGRQGDPGSSQFYVSLQDNLMRLFGSDRIAKMMDRMGLKEGEVIQHSMITKSIERAQKKVEENNFGIRKRLLEYDDVMNSQRAIIYKRRKNTLNGERLQIDVSNMIHDYCQVLIDENKATSNYQNFEFQLISSTSSSSPFSEETFKSKENKVLVKELFKFTFDNYKKRLKQDAELAFPFIKNIYENQGNQYGKIAIPFTNGEKELTVVTNLKEAYESECKSLIADFEKNVTLAIIDDAWKDQLRQMDELKQSVQNATYEQKDPLLIYKFESFELFKSMLDKINKEALSFLFKGQIRTSQDERELSKKAENRYADIKLSKASYHNTSETNSHEEDEVQETIVRNDRKIGRNEKVTVVNIQNGEQRSVKYKQAMVLVNEGNWAINDQ